MTEAVATEKFTFFWKGPFGQWSRSYFSDGERTYSHAEQYMMYQKAKLFEDHSTARKIMETSSPREQQALGRQVKNFNKEKWDQNAKQIVIQGNLYKYRQNPELKKLLMETKGTTLVEASPIDKIWGIGLAEDDPKALDRTKWLGTNWLGECLTAVRTIFEEEVSNERN